MIKDNSALRNSLVKMFNVNRDYAQNEIARVGSVQQRDTTYRRNGILNFGGRQMINLSGDFDFYNIGIGGGPIVS